MKKTLITVILISILSACAPATDLPVSTIVPAPTSTAVNTPMPKALWISPAVPSDLLTTVRSWDIPIIG